MSALVLPPAGNLGAGLPPEMLTKLRGKAQEFEATTIGQLLQPMFDTVDTSKDLFSGGAAEQQWKPMMVAEMAKQIARAGGIGLAQPVLQSLIATQETASHAPRMGAGAAATTPTDNTLTGNTTEESSAR